MNISKPRKVVPVVVETPAMMQAHGPLFPKTLEQPLTLELYSSISALNAVIKEEKLYAILSSSAIAQQTLIV